MPRITFHLDSATHAMLQQAAAASCISKSRLLAEAIRRQIEHEWPRECVALAGKFTDFPLREEGLATQLVNAGRPGS